jgi:hypothetical protein
MSVRNAALGPTAEILEHADRRTRPRDSAACLRRWIGADRHSRRGCRLSGSESRRERCLRRREKEGCAGKGRLTCSSPQKQEPRVGVHLFRNHKAPVLWAK